MLFDVEDDDVEDDDVDEDDDEDDDADEDEDDEFTIMRLLVSGLQIQFMQQCYAY